METMKEITVNINGMGGMALFRASRALKDDSQVGHDIVVTSGEDGVVYLTDLNTESVVSETVMCDGAVPSCAVTPEQTHLLVVQEEDSALYSYALPTGASSSAPQLDKLLYRSTVAIRHVACSSKLIAIADEASSVKVLVRSALDRVIALEGHSHSIKSVAIDPTEQFVCSSSEDGTVRVFAIDTQAFSATERAVFGVSYRDVRDDDVVCRCAWQRGTAPELLAVPVAQGVIELYARSNWQSTGQLVLPIGKSTASEINIVAFSPNGLYVAAATLAKQVFVWAVATKEVVRSFKLEYGALGVDWTEGQNALVVYHAGGKVAFVKDVIPIGRTPPQVLPLGAASTNDARPAAKEKEPTDASTKKRKHATAASFIEDEAFQDDHGSVDGDDDDDDNETRVEAIKASFGFGAAAKATDVLDDDDVGDTAATATSASTLAASHLRQVVTTEPFQSGSVLDSAVCLLAWTPVGEIETIRGASGRENLVKVEFADKARRGFKFSDQYLFTMASLDDHGAFFGVPRRAQDDEYDDADAADNGVIRSFVFYRPFESWASNSSWHLALPDGEDAECVAAAAEFCAVATSLHCVRIYTTSGLEYALLRLPGRIVTMAAKDSHLALVYQQDAMGTLAYELLDVHVHAQSERVVAIAKGVLPLSPPPVDVFASHKETMLARADPMNWSTLTWLGFDDRGLLYAVDSLGCVQALSKSVAWHWFPIGCVGNALTKKPDDRTRVFPLGIVNDALLYFPLEKHAKAPKLRGKHRPVPLTYALRTAAFPKTVLGTSSDKKKSGAAAEPVVNVMWQNVRVAALEGAESDDTIVHEHAEMDKALILMMKSACANDEPARVLDLAKCLHLEKSHQIAQKLAIHFGLRQLQSELYQLYFRTFEAPREAAIARDEHDWSQRSSASTVSAPPQEPLRASLESKALLSRRVPRGPAAATQDDHVTQDTDDHATTQDDGDASVSTSSSSSFFAKPGASAAAPAKAPVVVERSVAPANPFLKKPAAGASDDASAKSGLGRLAKFSSPPPVKKRKAGSNWK